jgi:leucyl-tRNA synthetase
MKEYNAKEIEQKWQSNWSENKTFEVDINNKSPKKYVVPMFPYPSGSMHMGHMRNYTISDIIARYWRNKGYNTFHAIGWDSFGSPAETAAINRGVHPKEWTDSNISNMRDQMKKMGISFDWSKEISTCEQDYWKWEQKFFIDMWEAGFIERKVGIVNWDPVDESVISNDQVINGRGWRSGAIVEKKEMTQYYFKTTMFATEMAAAIDDVEKYWPEIITRQQKNFIRNGIKNGDTWTPFQNWCISRQKYWGTPIPVIHCKSCGIVMDKNTVVAPYDVKFNGKGNPIDNHPTWKYCKCPTCGSDAERETDTMDTFVQSSWYFIRYISAFNGEKFDYDSIKHWFPIDYYIGGPEHACGHMIYSRFFWRMFKKMGYIPEDMCNEPFGRVITQGMVKKDGKKMSKSAGNVVSPDEIIEKWGADIGRAYIIFAGPPDQDIEWSDSNIVGVSRFINKFWNGIYKIDNMIHIENKKDESWAIQKIEEIKKKTEFVYEKSHKFNTMVSSAMECYNAISKQTNPEIYKNGYMAIIDAIDPICPHICSEIKEFMKNKI